jgi:hypothetical protein
MVFDIRESRAGLSAYSSGCLVWSAELMGVRWFGLRQAVQAARYYGPAKFAEILLGLPDRDRRWKQIRPSLTNDAVFSMLRKAEISS